MAFHNHISVKIPFKNREVLVETGLMGRQSSSVVTFTLLSFVFPCMLSRSFSDRYFCCLFQVSSKKEAIFPQFRDYYAFWCYWDCYILHCHISRLPDSFVYLLIIWWYLKQRAFVASEMGQRNKTVDLEMEQQSIYDHLVGWGTSSIRRRNKLHKKNIETLEGADVYPAAKLMQIHRGKVLKDITPRRSGFVVVVLSTPGVPTTIEYHKLILDVEDFKNGKVDTAFIVKHEEELAEVGLVCFARAYCLGVTSKL